MFHRQFPEVKISASTIERVYAKGHIRYKFINRVKKVIDFNSEHIKELFFKMRELILEA